MEVCSSTEMGAPGAWTLSAKRLSASAPHHPGDPTERRLAEALLAAVLEESFTLDRVRRDRVDTRSDVFTNSFSNMSHPPRRNAVQGRSIAFSPLGYHEISIPGLHGSGRHDEQTPVPAGNADVAVTSLEKRLSELEQLADAQSRELRIQFERIAQLQAEWDIVRLRSSKS